MAKGNRLANAIHLGLQEDIKMRATTKIINTLKIFTQGLLQRRALILFSYLQAIPLGKFQKVMLSKELQFLYFDRYHSTKNLSYETIKIIGNYQQMFETPKLMNVIFLTRYNCSSFIINVLLIRFSEIWPSFFKTICTKNRIVSRQ